MMKLRRLNHLLGRGLAASSLAGALLLGSACEPTNSTIGSLDEDAVAGGECDLAGETRGLKDGCNECTCGADLRWECTTLACDGGTAGTSGAGGSGGDGGSSGSTASGGTAGSTGGSGGSSGSAGSGGSAGTGGCSQQCSASEVSWHTDGGLVAFHDNSSLSGCREYRHIRTPVEVLLPQRECSVTLACTEQRIQQALSRADVIAAFDSGQLYGVDLRPVDGQLQVVSYQGKEIRVGRQCTSSDPPNCIPFPVGVEMLVDAVQDFDQDMLARQECANVVAP